MTRAADRSALVTGGTGFIGSHLVRRLVTDGWRVHVLVRGNAAASRLESVRQPLTVHGGDILDFAAVAEAVRRAKPAVIFHLAGRTDLRRQCRPAAAEASVAVNLMGTLHVLRAAAEDGAGVRRVVRAGGLEEYGDGPSPSLEDQREQHVSAYSASQVAATHFCQMLQRQLAIEIVTLRPALAYGPAQSTDFLIPSLIAHCLEGKDFALTSGAHGRDLIFVEDLVDAFLRAAVTPALAGAVINVGSGREYSMQAVAETVIRLAGAKIRLAPGPASPRAADLSHLAGEVGKAVALLGWAPTTALEEGLRRTIAWYREHGTHGALAAASGNAGAR